MKGVIINREVQPRRGQKTDIYVNAVNMDDKMDTTEILQVVIEVKGCWNVEVLTAMETQLLNDYMVKNEINKGIYVVGWYLCDKWDQSDYRKTKTRQLSLPDFIQQMTMQSSNLNIKYDKYSTYPVVLDLSI